MRGRAQQGSLGAAHSRRPRGSQARDSSALDMASGLQAPPCILTRGAQPRKQGAEPLPGPAAPSAQGPPGAGAGGASPPVSRERQARPPPEPPRAQGHHGERVVGGGRHQGILWGRRGWEGRREESLGPGCRPCAPQLGGCSRDPHCTRGVPGRVVQVAVKLGRLQVRSPRPSHPAPIAELPDHPPVSPLPGGAWRRPGPGSPAPVGAPHQSPSGPGSAPARPEPGGTPTPPSHTHRGSQPHLLPSPSPNPIWSPPRLPPPPPSHSHPPPSPPPVSRPPPARGLLTGFPDCTTGISVEWPRSRGVLAS